MPVPPLINQRTACLGLLTIPPALLHVHNDVGLACLHLAWLEFSPRASDRVTAEENRVEHPQPGRLQERERGKVVD